MTTITLPRATVEQALEVINDTAYGAPVFRQEVRDTITTLRAALAQSDDWTRCHHCGQTMPPVPLAQAEPDLSRCPQCNGPADNGFDRSIPPSPYLCTKCMAEPAQEPADAHTTTLRALLERCLSWEPDACVLGNVTAQDAAAALRAALAEEEPVAWECKAGGLKPLTQRQYDAQTAATKRHYTRIAPPQRQPLTEEEIDKIFNDLCNTVGASCKTMARAVEKAVWEKNHGQA